MKASASHLFHERKRHFDLSSGWSAGPLGYNPPLLRRAIREAAPTLQSPPTPLTAHEKAGLAGRLVHGLGLSGSWHLASPGWVDGLGLQVRSPFAQLESGLPLGPKDLPALNGGWFPGPFQPGDIESVRALRLDFPGTPGGFIPSLYLSRENPPAEDVIPGHPLHTVHGLVVRALQADEKPRNRARLAKVITGLQKSLPGLTALRGDFLWGLPLPRNLTPTVDPLNRKRIYFDHFTALTHGGLLLIQPSLVDVAEHLGHRLAELARVLSK